MAAVCKMWPRSTGISPSADVLIQCDEARCEEGLHSAMWTGMRGTLQMCSLPIWTAAVRG